MASTKKRFIAYLIDSIILALFLTIIGFIFPTTEEANKMEEKKYEITSAYVNKDITGNEYVTLYALYFQNSNKQNLMISIANVAFIIIYFVIIPFNNGGQTYGMKKEKIKIKKEKGFLSLNDLIIRNFIVNGLAYLLISLALIYILPSISYLLTLLILSLLQILLVIISSFMILYRKDNKGIQDIITKSIVVEAGDE